MRGRKLLLTALDWTRPKDPPLSLGHASILANLNQHQIPVKSHSWSVNAADFSWKDVVSYAMGHASEKTDFAIGAFVWNEKATQNIISSLKAQGFPGKVILGGPQISYVKEGLSSYYPDADIFIRGYGEEAIARLYTSDKEKPVIAGVSYRDEPDLGISANVDLEKLPSPYLTGVIPAQRFIRWETQRGCPFRCSFCQHRESDITMTRRNMPLTRILREAEWIIDNPVIQDIAVLDPTFNSGPNYLAVLDKLIEGKYTGKLALQCRIEMVKDEFLDKIQELNKTAHVVLEFGLQTTNKEEWKIIQRPNNLTKTIDVLGQTRERGIETEISLIFGLPKQTLTSFKDSIEFCKNLGVSRIYAYPLMLLRGTPLHSQKEELGLVESSDVNITGIPRVQEEIPHVVASPSFSHEEWKKMAAIAEDLAKYNEDKPKETWSDRLKIYEGKKSALKL
ncbi:MAG: radical domain protein [Rickettsiaceae bacterium]|jgi:radical SAM superfamily enzyme YgiQ (UPF0313 family)|nr:radical domain protein [Rickettsiaceae bacterium]